jgi:hypothetical protein
MGETGGRGGDGRAKAVRQNAVSEGLFMEFRSVKW